MNLLNFIFKPAKRIESELTVERMEALRKAANRAQPPDQVIGGKIIGSELGWNLEIPPASGGGGSDSVEPHQVLSVGEEKITIKNGLINGLLCLPLVEVNHTKTDDLRYVVLTIEMDTESGPTTATYSVENDAPGAIEWKEGDVPDKIELLIAILEGGKITQITTGNKTYRRIVAHEIPKQTVNVGEYPNNIYYTWIENTSDFNEF
jgi:hypothetical protein